MAAKKTKTEETMETVGNFWTKMADEQAAQMETFSKELQKWQEKGTTQASEAIEEMTKLMKSNMNYSMELQKQMQEQMLAGARQIVETFSTK